MSFEIQKPSVGLDGVPDDWSAFSREEKVQRLLDVIEEQMRLVRKGTFDVSQGERVAALVLEAQLDLAAFFTDTEASARNAKNAAEYIESKVGLRIIKDADKKPAEATIKRQCLTDDEVKSAKSKVVDYEKDYKKWKYVYEILKEAHILFRNISRLQ